MVPRDAGKLSLWEGWDLEMLEQQGVGMLLKDHCKLLRETSWMHPLLAHSPIPGTITDGDK